MDDLQLTSFLTAFQSYQDDGWVILKGCVQLLMLLSCFMSMVNICHAGRSVNLTTLFLGRLRPPKHLSLLCAHTFASN